MSLQLEQASLRRSGITVLRDVSLHVEPGSVHAVLGANGAGKSSLLRLLAGDLQPDSGSATLDAQAVSTIDTASLARQRSVLAQSSSMEFDFSVRQLIGLGRLPHAMADSSAVTDAAIDWALAQCELAALATRPITQLSGGQQRRAHIARVLAQLYPVPAPTPRYLLMDEPTAGLDLRHALQLVQRLRALAAEGLGVLWISHDINLAARHADTVTLLADGRVLAQGTPGTALTTESLARCYGLPMAPVELSGQRLWMPNTVDAN